MSYSNSPLLPKARAIAMRLLVEDRLPPLVVARKCGVHRSTIWRWKQKWDDINKHWQMGNPNRPNRVYSQKNHLARCQWQIPTLSSRPHSHPWTISDEIVTLILKTRDRLNRCAEVVWRYAVTVLGITVSLSSVRRILRRQHCFDGAREPRVKRDNPRRPVPLRPGELVETDTMHHVDPYTGRHLYYYTVIDLYSRMTHVTLATKLSPGRAANAVLDAQRAWQQCSPSFRIAMVQADNGQEYGRYF